MRFLICIWLIGFLTVGWVQQAVADGVIVSPELGASADSLTVFERFGPGSMSFYQRLSSSQHGFPYITETMWMVLNFLANVIMFMLALLAQGAITSLQWMLNLTLYQDNKIAIDGIVQSVAAQVYWPLLATSLAIGGAVAYGRMKREGGGSLFTDTAWLIATAVFAGAFMMSASNVLNDLDEARTLVSDGMLVGYASSDIASESAAGFAAVDLPQTTQGATRQLSDAMWNTSVVAPWCYAQFGSLDDCKNIGADYLTNSERWQELDKFMAANEDDEGGAKCPPEISNCDWFRGQSANRLGAVMFAAAVSLPQDIVQLGLAIFGIMAIITFLLLILVGALFVLGWPIPGKPREVGTKWFMELIGALLQSILITAVIGAVMVLSGLLTLAIPKYGLFGAAVLQIATMIAGWRLRGTMENIIGVGSGQASPFSSYMAMRAVGAIGRKAGQGFGLARKGGMAGARMGMKGAEGVFNAGYNAPDNFRRAATALQTGTRRVRTTISQGMGQLLPSRPFVSRPSAPAAATAPSSAGVAADSGSSVTVMDRVPRVREGNSGGVNKTTPGLNTPTRTGTATMERPARAVASPPSAAGAKSAPKTPAPRAPRPTRAARTAPTKPAASTTETGNSTRATPSGSSSRTGNTTQNARPVSPRSDTPSATPTPQASTGRHAGSSATPAPGAARPSQQPPRTNSAGRHVGPDGTPLRGDGTDHQTAGWRLDPNVTYPDDITRRKQRRSQPRTKKPKGES